MTSSAERGQRLPRGTAKARGSRGAAAWRGAPGGLAGQGRPRRDSDTGDGALWKTEAPSPHCSSPRGASNEHLCRDRAPPGRLPQTPPETPTGARPRALTVPLRRMLRAPALPPARDVARVPVPARKTPEHH